MQDRWDAVHVGCSTRGMQGRWDAGQVGSRTCGMQDRWYAGQVVYRTGRIIIIIINKRLFVSTHKIVQNIYI